jgi:glycosyltransferase involved in cell wall biosynthesis
MNDTGIRTLRVLFVSSEYPPETGFGGIGTYTRNAAEGLAARGHEVHVVCRAANNSARDETVNGVSIHRISGGEYPLPQGRAWYPLRTICYRLIPQSLVKAAWSREVGRKYNELAYAGTSFDIVEYPECGGEGFYLSRTIGYTAVARLHTPWELIRRFDRIQEPALDRFLLSYMESSSCRAAAMVSSPSQALGILMKRMWRLRAVLVCPNFLPVAEYPQTGGGDWIYVGRIERVKGTHLLIEAYGRLCETRQPPPLLLLGHAYGRLPDGKPYGEMIREHIVRKKLDNKVTWIEGVSHDTVIGHMSRSSAIIVPSLWENGPFAVLEAMSCGLAVVAARAGGLPEMIKDGENGILFQSGSAEALQAALATLLDNPGLAGRLGSAARDSAMRGYDAGRCLPALEKLYLKVLEKKTHG